MEIGREKEGERECAKGVWTKDNSAGMKQKRHLKVRVQLSLSNEGDANQGTACQQGAAEKIKSEFTNIH